MFHTAGSWRLSVYVTIGEAVLYDPKAIAIDAEGNIVYVLWMDEVKKYDPSGKFILKWNGCVGKSHDEYALAKSLAVDPQGNIYVGDSENGRIQKFDPSG